MFPEGNIGDRTFDAGDYLSLNLNDIVALLVLVILNVVVGLLRR